MGLEKPIFIISAGRSGSSTLHKLLAYHPDLAWLSGYCDKYPHYPAINRWILKSAELPFIGRLLRRKMSPWESYRFWETYCPGFSLPCRDLVAADVATCAREGIRRALAQIAAHRGQRLLLKITGWPRIGFLREIFPDAKFVHVMRDGRAVVNSILKVNWWWGWRGPENWRWGELPDVYRREWETSGKSFVALAGIQWRILMDAAEEARQLVPNCDSMAVRYEDLCRDPVKVFRAVVDFAELRRLGHFEAMVRHYPFRNTNAKWKSDLTPTQQDILQKVLADHLAKYGYK